MAYGRYSEATLGVSADAHAVVIPADGLERTRVDQMARLRAMRANGVSLREQYVTWYREELKPLTICPAAVAEERQMLKKVAGEVFDNLPALRGPVTQLTRALKAFSQDSFLIW